MRDSDDGFGGRGQGRGGAGQRGRAAPHQADGDPQRPGQPPGGGSHVALHQVLLVVERALERELRLPQRFGGKHPFRLVLHRQAAHADFGGGRYVPQPCPERFGVRRASRQLGGVGPHRRDRRCLRRFARHGTARVPAGKLSLQPRDLELLPERFAPAREQPTQACRAGWIVAQTEQGCQPGSLRRTHAQDTQPVGVGEAEAGESRASLLPEPPNVMAILPQSDVVHQDYRAGRQARPPTVELPPGCVPAGRSADMQQVDAAVGKTGLRRLPSGLPDRRECRVVGRIVFAHRGQGCHAARLALPLAQGMGPGRRRGWLPPPGKRRSRRSPGQHPSQRSARGATP